ncbi:TPA: DUF2282 domain-containing protein [Legionella pneumophila subsp. pneumophila]|nr:DUF2282 domain-containing protein [Legionella pneumophila]HAT9084922.1 DUF2282 domain-containing protein [Legionella pneumophila subsp. pneumophila]HAU9911365.1 DUF2282 domain-containing protein [Legionella pneumophila]HAV1167785.1 DUF2282 domain-containing protein [Legionella pneumophila]
MNERKIQNGAVIAAALGAGLISIYTNTNWLFEKNKTEALERCYQVVRAGKNDCATSKHSCAASDPEEFVMIPKGLCQRITGGKSA